MYEEVSHYDLRRRGLIGPDERVNTEEKVAELRGLYGDFMKG